MIDDPTPDPDRLARIERALAEYLLTSDAGTAPDPAAWLARYPDLQPELGELLAAEAGLRRLADPLRHAPGQVMSPEALTSGPGGHHADLAETMADHSESATSAPWPAPDPGVTTDPVDGDALMADGDPEADSAPFPAGVRIRYFGDYEIRRELGRGGMGVVYKARQISLNRPVALKMIRSAALASDDEVRRFRNEAEAVARLDHPHIVPIFEVGRHEDQHYFSMKLVAGGGLDTRLQEYVAEPRRAARLVSLAAAAIHHAHQRGILHRDLKPANILVDDRGEPYVTDFGLAKRVEGDSGLTQTGAILGTPAYMAPEQASSRRGAVTTASDVYGLGAILYALLTGRAPFGGQSPAETLVQVQESVPPLPSKLNQAVPRDLEVICLKCLEKDPARRFASAQALADDLDRYLAGEPILARPVGASRRAWMWCRRNPWRASALASTALAIVAVVVLSLLYADQTRRGRLVAESAKAEALRTALAGLHQTADSSLDLAKMMRYTRGEPEPRRRAMEAIQRASRLRVEARKTIQDLGAAAGRLAVEDPARWERRTTDLRSEATHWIGSFGLKKIREIPVPIEPQFDDFRDEPNFVVAPREDAQQVAVAVGGPRGPAELLLVNGEGAELRRVPLPPQAATPSPMSLASSELAFVGPDEVVFSLPSVTYRWNTSNDDLSRVPRPDAASTPAQQHPGWLPNSRTVEVRSDAYAASWNPIEQTLTVRTLDPSAKPRLIWKPPKLPDAQFRGPDRDIICRHLEFLGDSRVLAAYLDWSPVKIIGPNRRRISDGLLVVDAAMGLYQYEELNGARERVTVRQLSPLAGGFATAEVVDDLPSSDAPYRLMPARLKSTLRISVWEVMVPQARMGSFLHNRPVSGFDVTGEDRLVTALSDHLVHCWDGHSLAWSLGLKGTGAFAGGGAGSSAIGSKLRTFLSWPSIPGWGPRLPWVIGSSSEPEIEVNGYYWYGFLAADSPGFVAQRAELTPAGDDRLRTEVLDLRGGRVLDGGQSKVPAAPDSVDRVDPGTLIAVSDDRRYGIVAAEDRGEEWTLDLWEFARHRRLRTLGRYVKWFGQRPNRSQYLPEFSPTAHWLVIYIPEDQGFRVEFWNLPAVERTGTARLEGWGGRSWQDEDGLVAYARFDEVHRPLVRIGHQIFDLDAGTEVQLDIPKVRSQDGLREPFRFFSRWKGILVSTWQPEGFSGPGQVSAWDLAAGQRTDLGKADWANSFRGPRLMIHPDGNRLLIYGNYVPEKGPARPGPVRDMARVELWDLVSKTLLRTIERPGDERGFPVRIDGIIADHDAFYLPAPPAKGQPWGSGDNYVRSPPIRYAWSDGKELARPGGEIVAYDQPFGYMVSHGGGSHRYAERNKKWWAVWRTRGASEPEKGQRRVMDGTGLELQNGWNRRVPLSPPPIGPEEAMSIHEGRVDPQGRLFSLTYALHDRDPRKMQDPQRQVPSRTAVWDASTGRLLIQSGSDIDRPTFDATGRWLAIPNSPNGTIDLYGTSDFSLARRVKLTGLPRELPGQLPLSFQVDPGGDRLAFVHQGTLYLWDATADRAVAMVEKPGHFGPVDCVAQHPASQLIASGGGEGVILLWDRRQGKYLRTLVGHASGVVGLAFHPDGKHLASASNDGMVIFWDVSGRAIWTGRAGTSPVVTSGLVFDPTGSFLLVGTSNGHLLRFDVSAGQVAAEAMTDPSGLSAFSLAPSGRRVASASPRGHVRIWNGELSHVEGEWETGSKVDSLAFIGNDDFLLTGGKLLELRETATGRVLLAHEPPRAPIRRLQVDAGTYNLYFTDAGNAVHFIDLGDLNRVLGGMALEITGFPQTASPLLVPPLANQARSEPRLDGTGPVDTSRNVQVNRADLAEPPRAWSDLRTMYIRAR
jgi:WD40 repeat protein/tRNA A-37 threonylcarbamoyl transferase component Bud32